MICTYIYFQVLHDVPRDDQAVRVLPEPGRRLLPRRPLPRGPLPDPGTTLHLRSLLVQLRSRVNVLHMKKFIDGGASHLGLGLSPGYRLKPSIPL